VAPYLEHYSYGAVLLLVMIEDFGVPVPGETVLIAAAIFAGAGRLNVVLVGVVGFVAAVIGDNIGFAIGHFGGRALALRWGKYIFLTEERLTRAQYFFERHGGKIIVVARFIEGLRQANGIIAGISGMHWRRFVFFNAIGAALWVGTWVTLGYVAGNHINTIYHYITTYSYYALIAVVVLLAAYIILRVLRRRRLSAEWRAHEQQENLESPASAAIHERSEVTEQHEAQEDSGIQGQSEVQGGQEGYSGRPGSQASPDSRGSPGTQASCGPQEGAGIQEVAEIKDGTGIRDGAETSDDARIQEREGVREAAGIQETAGGPGGRTVGKPAGIQDGGETRDGARTQESPETQSS
jgi:membrane protein DedA with SNARE-associated domain